jgi:hypothetical protein
MSRFFDLVWLAAVGAACLGSAVTGVGCSGGGGGDSSRGFRIEGTEPGDCEDNADNDADGLFDCDDPGCARSSVCAAGGNGGTGGMGGNAGTGGTAGLGGMAGSGGMGGIAGVGGMAGSGGEPGAGGTGGTGGTGGSVGTDCSGGPLATPIPNCSPEPLPSTGDPYADCVTRINQLRWECQCLPALQRWNEAQDCANQHSEYDSTRSPHAGFSSDICSPRGSAQNECPGWGSTEQVINGCLQLMWDEGPGEPYSAHGHYINMTNPSYTMVACGFYETASGDVWSVQNFQ